MLRGSKTIIFLQILGSLVFSPLTRLTKSILSGTRKTETTIEINLPAAKEH